jgi:hypothetical protein
VVNGTAVTSAAGAGQGTQVTATASCPAGKEVLGGGAQVTTTETGTNRYRVVLVSSYPSNATTWTAVGMNVVAMSAGRTFTVTPYALCSE